MAEASGENEFYEDYIIINHKKSSVTINYSEISRCVETDTNFYLEYPNKNLIIIIQKNKCDLELINFIRSKFKNLENNLGDSSNFKGVDNFKNTDNTLSISYFMTFLFILTIGSLWGALWSYSLIDELNPQHTFNFLKNTWIFWCWLPIPITSIVLGYKYKNKGINCTKNIVGGFIIVFLLLIYGSFCLMPTFNEDYSKINDYIYIIKEDDFKKDSPSLLLNNLFYNKKINYTYKEYMEHLKLTKDYVKNEKNYEINYIKEKTFKNITISLLKNNYVIISKSSNPTIHFVIKHPKLIESIENFNPIVKE